MKALLVPVLVCPAPDRGDPGAAFDKIVDRQGVEETADFMGCEADFVPLAHDLMVGPGWEMAADKLYAWLREIERKP